MRDERAIDAAAIVKNVGQGPETDVQGVDPYGANDALQARAIVQEEHQ